jgi:type I restriction enzyme S subunit
VIADLKSYPSYKDSGVPWLGAVPEHWAVRRMKLLLREVDSRSSRGDEQLLRVSQYTGVTQRKVIDGSDEPNTRASSLVGYKLVAVNDFVVNIMLAWNGSMGVSRYDGIASPAYCVYRFRSGVRPWYYHELLRLPVYKGRIKTASTGVVESRLRLYSDDLGRIEAILPPCEEQDAIVRFLNHADRRIRRYILAKQKLIKLLEEQKQAIIHRAVTCGLDPNVRLKPSGVEWLGDVPEHWEVLRVKQCAYKISKGTTPSTEGREILEAGPVRFIKAENVSGGRIVDRPGCFIDEQTNAVLRRSQLREHDILFVIAGATLGKIAVVDSAHLPANTNQAVAFIRPNKRVNRDFLSLWLQSSRIRELIWLNAVQSAQPNLSMADLGNFVVPIPPLIEQRQILGAVSIKTVPVENAIGRALREISLLREYRTCLIADVVTGRLDVRVAAASLPDEADEPEPLDDAEVFAEGDEETEDADIDAVTEEAEA